MLDVEAFILVGGESSRMGSDKSQLAFDGQTGTERIAAALHTLRADVRPNVRLVGSHDRRGVSALENVPDTHKRWGALGGIHAALDACRAEWAVIVACDLPLVTSGLFSRLGEFTRQVRPQSFDAIVPIQPDGRPQPLSAFYRRESCLKEAERLITAGEHTPRALLANVLTRWVEFGEISDLPGAEHFFLNVNAPLDYERAKQILDRIPERSRQRPN
jgi:molybdopterin-guanine dinucleotide biosynthesis protein A